MNDSQLPLKRINPYKLFVGAFIPNWLLERPEVTSTAKLCYARLSEYAGESGIAYPSEAALAKAVALKPRQIRRVIYELKKHELIGVELVGFPGRNEYCFFHHPWMEGQEHIKPGKVRRPASEVIEDLSVSEVIHDLPDRSSMTSTVRSSMTSINRINTKDLKAKETTSMRVRARRERFFPDDFPKEPPDDFLQWAEKECPETDVRKQWPLMLDHEFDKPKSDWWRTAKRWMRHAPEFSRGHVPAPANKSSEPTKNEKWDSPEEQAWKDRYDELYKRKHGG